VTPCKRVRLTGTIPVPLPPKDALALFTPTGERAWAQGWEPHFPGPAADDTEPGTVSRPTTPAAARPGRSPDARSPRRSPTSPAHLGSGPGW
jgi:hypothetical protein